MFDLIFSEKFEKAFSKLKDSSIKKRIWSKVSELEKRAPIGKKLKGNPYWSLRINKFRIIYLLEGTQVILIDILERKKDYRGV